MQSEQKGQKLLQDPAPENLEALSAKFWLGPYAIILATLYLWGYWSSFHVNVLEHISFTEVIKIAAYPILSAFFFLAIGMLVSGLSPLNSIFPPGGGRDSKEGKFLNRHINKIVVVLVVVIVLVYLLGPVEKWIFLPTLFAVLVALPVKSTGLLSRELRSEDVRSLAIFAICFLIPFSYGRGIMNASSILSGKEFLYSTVNLRDSQLTVNFATNTQPRYLGKLNDHFFFYDPVKETTLLFATSELKAFDLKSHKGSTTSQAPQKIEKTSESGSAPQSQESNRLSGSTGSVR